jgi:hypothetical protein
MSAQQSPRGLAEKGMAELQVVSRPLSVFGASRPRCWRTEATAVGSFRAAPDSATATSIGLFNTLDSVAGIGEHLGSPARRNLPGRLFVRSCWALLASRPAVQVPR